MIIVFKNSYFVDTTWYQGLSNINTCRPGLVVPPEPNHHNTTNTAMLISDTDTRDPVDGITTNRPVTIPTRDLNGFTGPTGHKVQ